jgi:hypothetical protein
VTPYVVTLRAATAEDHIQRYRGWAGTDAEDLGGQGGFRRYRVDHDLWQQYVAAVMPR